MHAALRRMKCAPVSYTLIHPGADEVGSLGVFTSEQSAALHLPVLTAGGVRIFPT